jgi:hypothetical protein
LHLDASDLRANERIEQRRPFLVHDAEIHDLVRATFPGPPGPLGVEDAQDWQGQGNLRQRVTSAGVLVAKSP